MIELNNISKTFTTSSSHTIQALQNIHSSIYAKDYVVVVGSNGSGKSSLLNAIAGAFFVTAGEIFINKTNVTALPDYKRTKWIARIFQNPLQGTAPALSIIDNFRLAALRTQSKKLQIGTTQQFIEDIKSKISLLGMGLENKTQQLMGSLSGGQRQALTLLMSVMDESKILLMDEPTAALDPKSAQIVMQTANNIVKQYNLTALLVTHNIKDAFTYGNRIIQMSEGKIIKDISAQEKQQLSMQQIFEWF